MKEFTDKDVCRDTQFPHIYCNRSELVDAPMWWHKRYLSETASGYGRRLNSGLKIHFNGRLYRIYVTCFSNAGTSWFKCKGETIYVS